MSQGRTNPAPTKPTRSTAGSARVVPSGSFTVGVWWRRGISLLLLAHLVLVIAVPLTMMPPRSRLAVAIVSWVRPYLDMTQLSHGYGFFASEPGPSHLVEYQLEFAPKDGQARSPVLGQFPDIKTQRPRLRYHRHFMLSEKLASFLAPRPEPPRRPSDDFLRTASGAADWENAQRDYQAALADWQKQQELYQLLVKSYAQHLMAENNASAIRIHVKTHMPAPPDAVAAGTRLDDPIFYTVPPESEAHFLADAPPAGTEPKPEEIASPPTQERSVAIPGERR